MLFHTNPNVETRCQRVGIANVCISTGFAVLEPRKGGNVTAAKALWEKKEVVRRQEPAAL